MRIILNRTKGPAREKVIDALTQAFKALGHETFVLNDVLPNSASFAQNKEAIAAQCAQFKPDLAIGYGHGILLPYGRSHLFAEMQVPTASYWLDDIERILPHGLQMMRAIYSVSPNDHLFVWDEDLARHYTKVGIKNVHYLPAGFNTFSYVPHGTLQNYILGFAGAYSPAREHFLAAVCDMVQAPLTIFGERWDRECSADGVRRCHSGELQSENELANFFTSCAINLNHTNQGVSSANCRFFEVLGSGGFLLSDYRSDHARLLGSADLLVEYSNTKDLREKIIHYLANPKERADRAQKASAIIRKEHSYLIRAQQMIEAFASSSAQTQV